jgi:hypothetical protein
MLTQKVTVEHVHVHAGGQAVVGVVENSGKGSQAKSEDQYDAKQIAHALQPAIRRPNAEGDPVPVASVALACTFAKPRACGAPLRGFGA